MPEDPRPVTGSCWALSGPDYGLFTHVLPTSVRPRLVVVHCTVPPPDVGIVGHREAVLLVQRCTAIKG